MWWRCAFFFIPRTFQNPWNLSLSSIIQCARRPQSVLSLTTHPPSCVASAPPASTSATTWLRRRRPTPASAAASSSSSNLQPHDIIPEASQKMLQPEIKFHLRLNAVGTSLWYIAAMIQGLICKKPSTHYRKKMVSSYISFILFDLQLKGLLLQSNKTQLNSRV